MASQNANKGYNWAGIKSIAAALHRNHKSLEEMADKVVAAALDGEPWAIQEIARAIDE